MHNTERLITRTIATQSCIKSGLCKKSGRLMSVLLLVFLVLVASCQGDGEYLSRLERIKKVGDSEPETAIKMLDSLDMHIVPHTDYGQKKHDLLRVRLRDKAYIEAKNDKEIKPIVEYMESHGRETDLQEAYYYAGSVYRDLKDMPRAIDYFRKSEETADRNQTCDSLLLRNTFSNLYYAFTRVQDFSNAKIYAVKEYELSDKCNYGKTRALVHLASVSSMLGEEENAKRTLQKAMNGLTEKDKKTRDLLYSLITNLSELGMEEAKYCHELLMKLPPEKMSSADVFTIALYNELMNGDTDAAIKMYKDILTRNDDLYSSYDAVRHLYRISKHRGDKAMMLDYGEQYMRITDSLNMGKRQELAATANNQYQYYKDIEEIQQTIREKDRYRLWTFGTLSVLVLVVSSSLVAYYYKKNKYLQRAMSLSGHLKATKEENATLTRELERRRAEIDAAHKALLGMRAQAERLSEETARYEAVIREQEQQLAKRDEQNERYRLMLTKTHLEDTARNVMENVRMAAVGKHDMTEDDWTALQLSIDGMHPTFSDEIKKAVGTCNEQQRRVYYLLRAGLTARQIQAILPVPRSTLWRWIKRLSETNPDIVHIEE